MYTWGFGKSAFLPLGKMFSTLPCVSHAQWAFPDEWDRKEFIGPYPPGAVDAQQVADAWNAVRGKSPNEAAFARVGDTPIFVVTNAKMRAFWEARPTEWHGMWRDDIYI